MDWMTVYVWIWSQRFVLHTVAFASTLLPFFLLSSLVGVRLGSEGDDSDDD